MNTTNPHEPCCRRFEPESWDGKSVTFRDKLFVRDKVMTFFHIPLDFSGVMKRIVNKIKAANAEVFHGLVLTDDVSSFSTEVYVEASTPIEGVENIKMTGTFLSKVFEGPYSKMPQFIKQMQRYVAEKKEPFGHLYTYYPTCPNCSKRYGKNYVVLLVTTSKTVPE